MTAAMLFAFYAVMTGSLAFAWFRGGDAERTGVLLLIGFLLFRLIFRPLIPAQFGSLDPLAFTQDLIGFAGFVWIGLRARRYWPLIAAALQLLSVCAHVARAMSMPIDPWAYALTKSVPTLLVYVVLAIGTASYRHRVRRWTRSVSSPDFPGPAMGRSWRRLSDQWPGLVQRPSSSRSTTAVGASSAQSNAPAESGGSSSTTET